MGYTQRAQLSRFAAALAVACAFAAPASAATPHRSVTGLLSTISVEHGTQRVDPNKPVSTGGDRFTVTTDSGRVVPVPRQRLSLVGSRVTITDSQTKRAGVQGLAHAVAERASLNNGKLGARTVAVVRINFTDDRSDPGSVASIQDAFNGPLGSVNAFYQQQSGGTVSFTGLHGPVVDVFGIYQLPMSSAGCDATTMANDADTIALGQGVDLNLYDHIVFVFPPEDACSWAGLGQEPGRVVWSNGYVDVGVFAHELGHNLGANHAATLQCVDAGGNPVPISSNCSQNEYGDPYDVMGNSWTGPRLMSTWHRAQIGELPLSEQATATNGTYALSDANAPGVGGTRLLLVPRVYPGVAQAQYFALEIRGGLSLFDVWDMLNPEASGVTVRLVPSLAVVGFSNLLDMHPGGAFSDAPLASGQSFTDPSSGVVITDVSSAAGTAQVQISGLYAAPTSTSPTASSNAGIATTLPAPQHASTPGTGTTVTPNAIQLLAPVLVAGRAKIARTRAFVAGASGAGRVVIKVNNKSAYAAKTAWGHVKLTPKQVKRSTILVVASGGTLAKKLQRTYLVRRGVITAR